MRIASNYGCFSMIPERNQEARAACLRSVADGRDYFYESTIWLPGPGFVAVVLLFVAIGAIVMVLNNDELDARRKTGWVLGMVLALPVFLPLYLVLVPAPAIPAAEQPGESSA